MTANKTATASKPSRPADLGAQPKTNQSAAAVFDHWANLAHPHPLTPQERDDDHLVGFFSRWAPFGGGDEVDIMSQFGIDKRRFLTRLRELALSPRICRYPREIQKLLLDGIAPNLSGATYVRQ